MDKQPLKRWEIALITGLIMGMLATPAGAEGTVLSRWPTDSEPKPLTYQICLFPFAVGQVKQEAMAEEIPQVQPQYQVKFKLAEWWESLTASKTP